MTDLALQGLTLHGGDTLEASQTTTEYLTLPGYYACLLCLTLTLHSYFRSSPLPTSDTQSHSLLGCRRKVCLLPHREERPSECGSHNIPQCQLNPHPPLPPLPQMASRVSSPTEQSSPPLIAPFLLDFSPLKLLPTQDSKCVSFAYSTLPPFYLQPVSLPQLLNVTTHTASISYLPFTLKLTPHLQLLWPRPPSLYIPLDKGVTGQSLPCLNCQQKIILLITPTSFRCSRLLRPHCV